MPVILFIIILAVLIFVHELGHFLVAKRFGVRVDEFGFGFPPRIWGKKVGETIYSINWIPFGGFVKIFGETPDGESISGPDSSRSFVNVARWKQAVILASGVLFNILLAWLLFSIAYLSGMTTIVSDVNARYVEDKHVIVLDVLPGSPAEKAGLVSGDGLLAYSFGGATTTIGAVEEVQAVVKGSEGAPVTFAVRRNGEEKYVSAIPERSDADSPYVVGISMDLAGKVSLPVHLAIWEGGALTVNVFKNIAINLYVLIHDAILGQADLSQVSGPIGIARLVGDAGKLGIIYLFSFTAFISLNLAVLNLLPFPALDGGRIVFVAIEAIRRKAIAPSIANGINAVGFGVLILFMIFITYRDIIKLF